MSVKVALLEEFAMLTLEQALQESVDELASAEKEVLVYLFLFLFPDARLLIMPLHVPR